jgi:hypothetical protein
MDLELESGQIILERVYKMNTDRNLFGKKAVYEYY